MSLTQGSLLTICQGGQVNSPVMQILSFKKIPSASTERFRLLISDGLYSNSCAMLATQLNSLITDGQIDEYCVIRVNKHSCNNMQGKKVIIILELDILRSGAQVGQKIGTPVPIQQDGSVNENDRKESMKRARKSTEDESNNGQPASKKPFQQVTNRPSMLQSPTPRTGGTTNVFPIAALTPYQNKWTIKARVTNKSDIRRWSNSRGEGHLFSMDLIDESGEIRATAFKAECDKFYDMIEIGKVYYITTGTLKSANRQYSTLNNEYEMTFKETTEVSLCTDSSESAAIPTVTFNFCKISALDPSLANSNVDILAIVKSAGDCVSLTSRAGKELTKRELVIFDQSLSEITLTIWGTNAQNYAETGNPVIAIKGARVSDFGGVSLSTGFSSILQFNPDLPQTHELRGWYDSEGSTAETKSLTQAGGQAGNYGANEKSFGECKKENFGMNSDKPEYYSNTAWITLMMKDKALYQGCPNLNDGKTCNKKVQDQGDGTYRCEKCGTSAASFNWRLITKMAVADATDNQWVNCFQEQGEALLGTSAEELGNMFLNDRDAYDKVFTNATFQRFNLRFSAKADFYNDEARSQHTIRSSTPMDYQEYCKKMIKDLETAGISLPHGVTRDKYL